MGVWHHGKRHLDDLSGPGGDDPGSEQFAAATGWSCHFDNHSFAGAAGGVISTAADLATWISALTTGAVLNPEYQHLWLDSVQLEDPNNPAGTQYGYGIARMHWGPNAFYYHGGETAGYNSFMGYDPTNKVTLVVWTNLTVSLDQVPTANALMLKVLDQMYAISPIPATPSRASNLKSP